jgi:hypothetical protein
MFLRGHGSQAHSQVNGSTVGVTSTNHESGALGVVQGDATRNITGDLHIDDQFTLNSGAFYTSPVYNNRGADNADRDRNSMRFARLDISRVVPVATENRPVNVAVRYLIRALK